MVYRRAAVLLLVALPAVTSLIPPEPSAAATYYVDSARGRDRFSGLSPRMPWRSLAKVSAKSLRAGDHVLLRGGSRWHGPLRISSSGTRKAPLRIGTYGGGPRPVIAGGGSCVDIAGSFVLVRNLTAEACDWAGFRIGGSHDEITASVARRNVVGVHLSPEGARARIVGNRLVDNNRMSVNTPMPTSDDSGVFGVLLNGDDSEIAHNRISGSDAYSYDFGRDGAAVEVSGGRRNAIHHNRSTDNHDFTELGNSRSTQNIYTYNVVTSSLPASSGVVTRGAGSAFGPVYDTRLYQNTFYLTGDSSQGVVCHAGCGPQILRMRNNLVQARGKAAYADAPFDEDHDLFWGGSLQLRPGVHSLEADPRFRRPSREDFRLKSSSPAVDAGEVLGYELDFDGLPARVETTGRGQRPDLGAFELQRSRRRQR